MELELKVGMSVQFRGMTMGINGYICEIEKNGDVLYLRDSLTRWAVSKTMMKKGREITLEDFLLKVKVNSQKNGHVVPTTIQIKKVLKLFTEDFDKVDMTKVHKILNVI